MVSIINNEQCMYCKENDALQSLMTKVCELRVSTVYLMNDQKYHGRCVVALNNHKTELFQLTNFEGQQYFKDLTDVAKVLTRKFDADKINYGIYGDLVPHVHMHLVPKKIGGLSWGVPFDDSLEKIYLTNEDKMERIVGLAEELKVSPEEARNH